jgi:nucleoside-diphosphate-sugar epimerase
MARILVTGASGFVGRHLVPLLAARGHVAIEAGRRPRPGAENLFIVGEIGPHTDWQAALRNVDAVVHLAGLAHREDAGEAEFFAVNDGGTRRLAEASEAAGVKALIAVSSIAAREATAEPGRAGLYGRSKLAGEAHVLRFAEGKGAGIVLRPPLVYGHDASGNWQRLQRLAASGLPLPFGAVANRRSLCAVGNLCHAIATAVEAGLGGAGSGVYEMADRETVSLTQILAWLRAGMKAPGWLAPVPSGLLRTAALATGQRKLAASLLDDLTVDPSGFIRAFAWSPPERAEEAIRRSGELYAAEHLAVTARASAAS